MIARLLKEAGRLNQFIFQKKDMRAASKMATRTILTPEVKITGRANIKPLSPTPPHLRKVKLSLLEQMAPVEYGPMLYFYTANPSAGTQVLISQRLKTSLSETLTRFYSFAGIIKENSYVDCIDDGVQYVEAQANCLLSDVLQQPDFDFFRRLLPIELSSTKAATAPLLLIQITFFKCGGMAIGYCFSHLTADGCAIISFINHWTAAARGQSSNTTPVYADADSFFPQARDGSYVAITDECPDHSDFVTKRFVFDKSSIAALKNKVASSSLPNPTRVEAVASLMWKCQINSWRSIRGFPTLSLLAFVNNLRPLFVPPLPLTSVGNAIGFFFVEKKEKEIELSELACKLRKSKEQFRQNGLQAILQKKNAISNPELGDQKDIDIDISFCSGVCGFSIYNADFGWGNPLWVTSPYYFVKNLIMLIDSRDGKGVEANVTLIKEDMALFERDPELLAFAASNPSVLHTRNGSPALRSGL